MESIDLGSIDKPDEVSETINVDRWAVARHKCRHCYMAQISVYPATISSIQCAYCGKMTGMSILRRTTINITNNSSNNTNNTNRTDKP